MGTVVRSPEAATKLLGVGPQEGEEREEMKAREQMKCEELGEFGYIRGVCVSTYIYTCHER